MPAHDGIAKLLSGACKLKCVLYFTIFKILPYADIFADINYFHCLKIIEILKETEAETKNVFGRYGSQRMKDWQEILRAYEKDNIYLAEVAQILARNVNYEVPSTKKQIQKLEQLQIVSLYNKYYLLFVCHK